MIPNALTIAGSDPGGGAGIQADLKTFSALGVFGTTVIAALTAQNTQGVTGIHTIPVDFIALQIDTLYSDIRIDAVKVGMVGTAGVAAIVADRLKAQKARNIVVDPVMVAKGGASLIDNAAVAGLKESLIGMATIITPNIPEGARLTGRPQPTDIDGMRDLAAALYELGSQYVLLKGGHLTGKESVDLLYDGSTSVVLSADRIPTKNTHGTGCTLSSAVAALLAKGRTVEEAVLEAKEYITGAIRESNRLNVGHGHGPVHHFHGLWKTN